MIHHRPQRGILRPLGQTGSAGRKVCVAPNGDVYLCGSSQVLKQAGGVGNFAACGAAGIVGQGICAAPNGDIYVCVYGGSIWILPAGSSTWENLNAASAYLGWNGICATPSNSIYVCDNNGSIWMRTNGAGAFADLAQSRRYWSCMGADSDGNVYAGVNGTYLYKQTGGSGAFGALTASGLGAWFSLCSGDSGEMFASRASGGIWRKPPGSTTFALLSTYSATLNVGGLAMAPNRACYVSIIGSDVHRAVNGLSY